MSNTCIRTALAALALVTIAYAQAPAAQIEQRRHPGTGRAAGVPGGSAGVARWTMAEMGASGAVVKGAPYSAQAVTEVNQTLADGNKIHRTMAAAVYRDSEGRTRNESVMGGELAGSDAPQLVMINDPVAGLNYLLDPAKKTAIKTALPTRHAGTLRRTPGPEAAVRHVPGGVAGIPGTGVPGGVSHAAKTESLGTKQIEGVQAEGTRFTTTVPAGQIGNDRPIDIVTERWYSPQLQAVVLVTHSDPRTGQSTYKLTKINLGEPDRSLFEVPAGYAVSEGGAATIRHRQEAPAR
jgi:hypothetical protein